MFRQVAGRIKLKMLLPGACCMVFVVLAARDYSTKIERAGFDVECATLSFLIYWHIKDGTQKNEQPD